MTRVPDPPRLAGVHLTERTIPVPKSISPEAQAALAVARPRRPPAPPISDKAAWRAYVAETNAGFAAMMKTATAALPARSSLSDIAGVPVYVGEPDTMPAADTICQAKLTLADPPRVVVTVTLGRHVPAVTDGVPVIFPVVLLIARPDGRPVALKRKVFPFSSTRI